MMCDHDDPLHHDAEDEFVAQVMHSLRIAAADLAAIGLSLRDVTDIIAELFTEPEDMPEIRPGDGDPALF